MRIVRNLIGREYTCMRGVKGVEMKKLGISLLAAAPACSLLFAQSTELEPVEVLGKTEMVGHKTYIDNAKTVDNDLVQTLSIGGADYNEAVKLLPSVNTEEQDPYALTVDQNTIRVRGQVGDTFSKISNTIDGVPFSVNVGQGGNGYLLDANNIGAVDFYTGAIPPDKGLGLGDTAGALDMQLRGPKEHFGLEGEQGYGTDAFHRSFGRVDTGKIGDLVSAFVSGSSAGNEKWRGRGEINRTNLNAMTKVDLGSGLSVELFGAYNRFDRHEYRPLTYAQTKDLSHYYDYDYNEELTGTASEDMYYYDYNKQKMTEYFTYANIEMKFGDALVSLKPYYFGNDGKRMFGKSNAVMKVEYEQDAYGGVAEVLKPLFGGLLTVGMWYQELESMPPPAGMKKYKINSDGSLTFQAYTMLTKMGKRTSTSPFVSYEQTLGAFKYLAGARYIDFAFPAVTGYVTTGIGDVSVDDALDTNPAIKEGMQVHASHSRVWLPSLMATYALNREVDFRASYNRTYANPWQGPLWSVYNSNTATFQAAGISLQDLWDELKLEIADNFELGAKWHRGNAYTALNAYYAKVRNKQVTVYDPNVGLSYYLSNADAESKGVELEGGLSFGRLDLYASAFYNRYEFTEDIVNKSDSVLQAKGNQVPDAPEIGAKLGAVYRVAEVRIKPVVKFISKRYGDVENTESVSPYATIDLGIDYTKRNVFDGIDLKASLDIQNLMDKQYISVVKNDLDDTSTGATSYYPGAPMSAVFSVALAY